jgi:HD-GYP domain-containing protein (c-di-GMP phosphodiesterase class II)
MSLEEQIGAEFRRIGISKINIESVNHYLGLLKRKDEKTYEHSIRVGITATKIAEYMHLNPRPSLFSGCLHDIGKLLIDSKILKKTVGFGDADRKEMKNHPQYTYQMLKGVHEYSAEIALRHHKFQENGYPENLPEMRTYMKKFSSTTMINFYARILSLADFYDAAKYRENDRNGEKRLLTSEEVKEIVLRENKDQTHLINELYKSGVFS